MTILIVSKEEQKNFVYYDKKDFKLDFHRYIFKNIDYFSINSKVNNLILYENDCSITMKYNGQIKIQININKEIK